MAHAGYFPISDVVEGLRMFGSPYQGHPERVRLPSLETTSGPLGSGLSQAAGIALALRMDKLRSITYCVMSDGEQQAGNTWEAVMFAGVNQIGNLTAIIDSNNIQINGFLQDVMPIEPLRDKYESFGWHVMEVDGHNIEAFVDACEEARAVYNKPSLIIAHTIPGKGIEETEFDFEWHGKPPTAEEGEEFLKELRTLGGRIHNADVN